MSHRSNFLDADNSMMERNLRFVRNDMEDNMNQFFGGGNDYAGHNSNEGDRYGRGAAPPRDYRVVKPMPGFCIKSFKVNTNEKYFINVCQHDDIPPPEDFSEQQLANILESDAPSSFRIPMSISEPRITKDKSDNPVDVCDIAINPNFFMKLEKSTLFKDFFLNLIAEALNDKYNVQIKIDKSIILNNRKFIGTLVSHRVRNNDVKTVLKSYQKPTEADKKKLQTLQKENNQAVASGGGVLIQEVNAQEVNTLKKRSEELKQNSAKLKQQISMAASVEPEFKLRAKLREEQVDELQAEFYLPKCISSQEVTLDIGEDRILLESMKRGYLFDKFVNYRLNQEGARAIFDKTNKMLQLRIPVFPV